jgi:hypothetical protein
LHQTQLRVDVFTPPLESIAASLVRLKPFVRCCDDRFRQIADESAVQKNGNVFDVIAISFLRSDDPGCQPTIR